MSNLVPALVACPRCGHEHVTELFDAVDAVRLAPQADHIAAGEFERVACAACGHAFRPEHRMLFVDHARRAWIAMHPLVDRPRFAMLEHGLLLVVEREFAQAPPVVAEGLRGVRPRLVFGQHMLSEAVRVLRAGIAPALLECAKLQALERDGGALDARGPVELGFEAFDDEGGLRLGVHALPGGERVGELRLPPDALAEAQAASAELRRRYPALFERPYVSASRIRYGALVGGAEDTAPAPPPIVSPPRTMI